MQNILLAQNSAITKKVGGGALDEMYNVGKTNEILRILCIRFYKHSIIINFFTKY